MLDMQEYSKSDNGCKFDMPRTYNSFDTNWPVDMKSKSTSKGLPTHKTAVRISELLDKAYDRYGSQNFTCSTSNIQALDGISEQKNIQLRQQQAKLWNKVGFHQPGQHRQRKHFREQSKHLNDAADSREEKQNTRARASDNGSGTESAHDNSYLLPSTTDWKQIGNKPPSFWQSTNFLPFRQMRRNRRPRSDPSFTMRRHRTETSVQMPLPKRVLSCKKLKIKPSFANLRSQVMVGQVTEIEPSFNHSGSTLNLAHCEHPVTQLSRPKSPVPTLHDPVKDRCFMEECHELIIKLGKSWDASMPNDGFHSTKNGLVNRPCEQGSAQCTTMPNSSLNQDLPVASQQQIVPPVPPRRNSSKRKTRAAPLVNVSQSPYTTLSNVSKVAGYVHKKSPRSSNMLPRPRQTDGQTGFSDPGHSKRTGLKHFKSADTIAAIEAQLQDSIEAPLMLKMKRESTGKLSLGQDSRPSGEPPEKPLPELPKEGRSMWRNEVGHDRMSNGQLIDLGALIEAGNGERKKEPGENTPLSFPHTNSVALMKTTGKSDDLKASLRNQNATLTNSHFNKAPLENDAANAKPKPIIGTSCQRYGEAPIFASPMYQKDATNDLDELDRFPSVPHTRSSSVEDVSPKSSPRKPYPRRVSELNSMLHNPILLANRGGQRTRGQKIAPPEPEILARSQIMVIVDTDPGQEYGFRASTVSPASDRPSSRDNESAKETLLLSQVCPVLKQSTPQIGPEPALTTCRDLNGGSCTHRSSYRLRIQEDISRENVNPNFGHTKRTSRGRIIIEASDEEDNGGPRVQNLAQQSLPSSHHSRTFSTRDSSAHTSLFSISEERHRWQEFYQNAKEDYDGWCRLRGSMWHDLEGLFHDLRMTNVVLGRMAHVGRGFAPLDFDVADVRESLLGDPSTRSHRRGYSIFRSTSKGIKHRQRGSSKSSLISKPLKEAASEGKHSVEIRTSRGQRPIINDSASASDSTGNESDVSTLLFSPPKERQVKKKSSNDSLTDPRDYDYEPRRPGTRYGKNAKHVSSTVDQTVIKAASMSAIRRAAKHDPDQDLLPPPLGKINRSTASTPTGTKMSAEYEAKMLRRPLSPKPTSSPATFRRWQSTNPGLLENWNKPKSKLPDINHPRQLSSDDMDHAIDLFKVYM